MAQARSCHAACENTKASVTPVTRLHCGGSRQSPPVRAGVRFALRGDDETKSVRVSFPGRFADLAPTGPCRRPPGTRPEADATRRTCSCKRTGRRRAVFRVQSQRWNQEAQSRKNPLASRTLAMPCWLRVCRWQCMAPLRLSRYCSPAAPRYSRPAGLRSTWTMLASPGIAALRKHEANL